MNVVRRILVALFATWLGWASLAAAQPAHAHSLSSPPVHALHALAQHADDDHHAAGRSHDHALPGGVHHHDDDPSTPDQSPHEDWVHHFHGLCFVALAQDCVFLAYCAVERPIDQPVLIVALHTRSVVPADRPPRTFL